MLFKRKINKSVNFHENYNLVINCDPNNFITKKYFSNKFFKDYFSFAYTTIIEHKKITNNTAVQIFTKQGPLAFLPISNKKTSIVFSLRGEKKINLGEFAIMSRHIEDKCKGRESQHILEDIFEAFLGAMFLDFNEVDNYNLLEHFYSGIGFRICEKFMIHVIEEFVDFVKN